ATPTLTPTLFPYTTLFRSATMSSATATICSKKKRQSSGSCFGAAKAGTHKNYPMNKLELTADCLLFVINSAGVFLSAVGAFLVRSEEHTSELQSPYDLVCR